MIKTPTLCVDAVIEIDDKILLIKRKNPPYGWALPGGFVDIGETVEHAVIREVKEETSLDVHHIMLLGVYSDPKRDPRMHNVSVVFKILSVSGEAEAADDAKELAFFNKNELPELAFDHGEILKDYFKLCPRE